MSDDKLNSIEKKLDDLTKINREQTEILQEHEIKLATYNAQLREHIRRTELLEKRAEKIEGDMLPIRDHVKGMEYIKKFILFGGALAAATYTTLRLLGVI